MKLFRLARTAGVLSLGAVGFSGCLSEPSYPTTPSISFNSIVQKRYTITGAPIDSVFITINFQDGDGDLGVTEKESKSPPYYAYYLGNNYFMTPFVKNATTGRYDSLKIVRPAYATKTSFYNRFDHLSTTTDSRSAPLRGTLTRRYSFALGDEFLPNQEVNFRVSILDRALHRSNEVETTSIIIPR